MTTLKNHAAALVFLAIVLGFLGSLVAIGSITGKFALAFAGPVMTGVAAFIGFKIAATATTPAAVVTVPAAPAVRPVAPVAVAAQ